MVNPEMHLLSQFRLQKARLKKMGFKNKMSPYIYNEGDANPKDYYPWD